MVVVTLAVAGCSNQAEAPYQEALACYKATVEAGAIAVVAASAGIAKEGTDSLEELPSRWQQRVVFEGGKAGKAQDQIAGDLSAALQSAMTAPAQVSKSNIREYVAKTMDQASACVEKL